MKFELKDHLKSLVEAHAPSGHEGPVREIVKSAWEGLIDDHEQDRLGSYIGIKRATRPNESDTPTRRIMLAAHMDEIGMMVRDIEDGFIYVHRISGVDNRIMLSQPVMVHGKRALPGIVAAVPPHLLNARSRNKYPSFEELVIDVGLPAEEVAELVRIGDLITVDVPLLELEGGRLAAKAMDDRACLAAVTACLHYLQNMHHQWDVYAVATVQEETGLLGATTAAYQVAPDIAIALDVGFAPQPGVPGDDTIEIGKGPGIGIGANFHQGLYDQLQACAKDHNIKLQEDPLPANSGTDAWAIQVSRLGVPTALLEVPLRNMHSPVETAALSDIDACGRLMAQFIANLAPDFLATIDWPSAKSE